LFDFLFDTNSVRDFGRAISDRDADVLDKAWKAKNYKSAWIPWTIGELLGTNLAPTKPLSDADCKAIALAVRRFDRLASRDVLLGPSQLIKWSMQDYLGYPKSSIFHSMAYRELIEAGKTLTSPTQIRKKMLGKDRLHVRIKDANTGQEFGQSLPLTFTAVAEERVRKRRLDMQKSGLRTEYGEKDIVDKEPLLNYLWNNLEKTIIGNAKRSGFADKMVLDFDRKPKEEFLMRSFAYGSIAQDWYMIMRVVGVRPGEIEEAMGRDLVIANYMPLAKTFVTSDGGFTTLVKGILPTNIVSFKTFKAMVLA
jgi:hypothetical protein